MTKVKFTAAPIPGILIIEPKAFADDRGFFMETYNQAEFAANGFQNNLSHQRGVVSMARADSFDSAGSQFFIMVADNPGLDGNYAAFGKVLEGMDEVDKIVNVPRDTNQGRTENRPLNEQKMKKVTVETFGIQYPEPQKLAE